MNYDTLYSLAKRLRSYFSDHVVRAIQIGIYRDPFGGYKQSSLHASAHVLFSVLDRFQVKKRGLGRVALLSEGAGNPDHLALVIEHVQKPRMGDLHKVLVVALPHRYLLFPVLVFPNDDCSNALLEEQPDNAPAGRMEILLNAPVPPVGQAVYPM